MIQELIDRAKALKESEKLNYEKLSEQLGVSFSKEFKAINDIARFDCTHTLEWLNIDGDARHNSIAFTLFLRKEFNLPENTIAIADEGESLLLMKCFGEYEEIWWIDNVDIERFCNGEPLEAWDKVFPTFTDFFKSLLDTAEKSQAEDEAAK
jgi:transcriptional regulator with XRE-family HTH domain